MSNNIVTGTVLKVEVRKTGTNNKGPWTLVGVELDTGNQYPVKFSSFDAFVPGEQAHVMLSDGEPYQNKHTGEMTTPKNGNRVAGDTLPGETPRAPAPVAPRPVAAPPQKKPPVSMEDALIDAANDWALAKGKCLERGVPFPDATPDAIQKIAVTYWLGK